MRKLFSRLSGKDWGLTGLCLLLVAAQVWLDLQLPDYMREITMLVRTPGSSMSAILFAGGMMLLCALGAFGLAVMVSVISARVSTGFGARLRSQLFTRVQSFSMEEMNRFSTASLITRTTNDVTQVQVFVVMGLQALMRAPLMVIFGIIKILGKGWQWTLATGIAVLVLLVVVGCTIGLALPKMRKLQQLTDQINARTRENLTGLRVIRAYGAQEHQHRKFERTNEELTATGLFANRALALMMPGIQLVMNFLPLSIYWIGAMLIQNAGELQKTVLFPDMVVFSSYAMQIVMSFMMLVMIFVMLPRSSVAARRINEVLDAQPTIHNGQGVSGESARPGTVEFRDVSFRYPDAEEPVLEAISFRANPGETVAFIGATGSGKSTVIHLIPRFYDVTAGQVLVDGVDVREYTQQALRKKIGYVAQQATIFSGTVASNIAFGGTGGIVDEVRQAAHTAQASEFIDRMEGGYDASVVQGGANLSGGQRQRLSIARALYHKPDILILDDSFSALDYRTDRELRRALKEDFPGATRLIVAQRIGTVLDADPIIVMEDGRVVGQGTHQSLMQDCAVYQEIAQSQLSQEELAS